MKANRLGQAILLVGAVALAILGQYYFARKPDYFWDGVAFYAVAAALFLALSQRPAAPAPAAAPRPWRVSLAGIARAALIVFGLALGLGVVLQLDEPRTNYWPLFWLWAAGMLFYLAAFVRRPAWSRAGLRQALAEHGIEWAAVALLVAVALLLRAWRIDSIPWTLGGDEGSQGMWARDVLQGRLTNMFVTGWLSVPNLSFFWQAGWLTLFGDNMVGLRLPWAVVGAFTVLGLYLLVRRLFDRNLALLTAFLLATYHFHIHYSRLGSNQIADPLFTVWALYFMVVGWQAKRRWAWAVSGVIAGLAFYFYAGSRQVPVILAAALVWAVLTERDFLREHGRNLLALLGGFVVSVGPMAYFFVRHPNDFNARLNQVGLIQSGLLERIMQATGQSRPAVLADQFRKAFFAFNFYPDRVVWYGPAMPLMDFFSSILLALGAVYSAARLVKWRYAVFVIWFALVLALGGALTENPPSSQRLVSSAAPAVFFVAVALRRLTRAAGEVFALPELARRGVTLILAVALAAISLRFYFGPYQQSWTYGGVNAEVATRIGYYLRDLGPEYVEYFFGAPRMYADFGSTPFLAKGVRLYDVKQPLAAAPTFVDRNRKAAFVFLPERMRELDLVRRAYPNGVLQEVRRVPLPGDPAAERQQPLLFTVYRVDNW